MQVPGLHPEILAPPVRVGHGLPVQHRDRRLERLEYRERRNVDAPDGEPDRAATQVVGECFDLG
jgi:hypothetical protein